MAINCAGNLVNLKTPKIMGILNLTPDSFYDGGKHKNQKQIIQHTTKMMHEGADFIDVGAYSSRPQAADVSVKEELNRLLPIISLLKKEFPEILLSVDTFRSEVAQEAVTAGACLVNDISAGSLDPKMMQVVGKLQVPYSMMHMRGTPKTMQNNTEYEDLLQEIIFYFTEKIAQARKAGINDIIIDPGFGFAKTREQNFELLRKMPLLENLEIPILVGLSRKSMIYKTLGNKPEDALNGTSVVNTLALLGGASILRVHDVKEAKECVQLYTEFNQ